MTGVFPRAIFYKYTSVMCFGLGARPFFGPKTIYDNHGWFQPWLQNFCNHGWNQPGLSNIVFGRKNGSDSKNARNSFPEKRKVNTSMENCEDINGKLHSNTSCKTLTKPFHFNNKTKKNFKHIKVRFPLTPAESTGITGNYLCVSLKFFVFLLK